MESFFSSISNREYASFIILVAIIVYSMKKNSDITKALLQILKIVFFSKLTLLFIIPIIYLSSMTYLFFKCKVWDYTLLKDSTFAIVCCLFLVGKSINTDNINKIYKENILHYFSTIYFIEFFVNFYNFNIFFEILLYLFVAFVYMLSIYIESYKTKNLNTKNTKKFLNGILSFIGFFMLFHSLFLMLKEPSQLFNIHSLQSLILPILYTLLLYPLCYVIHVYSKYETTLVGMFVIRNNLNKKVSTFEIIYKTFKLCKFNIIRLKLWQQFFLNFYCCEEKFNTIDKTLNEFRQRYKHIESPTTKTEISLYSALAFMVKQDFPIEPYKYLNYSEGYGNYQALSYNCKDFNKYYCVIGNQQYPQKYILYDYIQNVPNTQKELRVFLKYCKSLYKNIFSTKLNKKYSRKLLEMENFTFENELYKVKYKVDTNVLKKVCSVTFEISKITPIEVSEYELQ